jgi:hypothetical protein
MNASAIEPASSNFGATFGTCQKSDGHCQRAARRCSSARNCLARREGRSRSVPEGFRNKKRRGGSAHDAPLFSPEEKDPFVEPGCLLASTAQQRDSAPRVRILYWQKQPAMYTIHMVQNCQERCRFFDYLSANGQNIDGPRILGGLVRPASRSPNVAQKESAAAGD